MTSWGPAGLFLLGLLVAVGIAYRRRLGAMPVASRIALGLLAAFVAWNFASIAWADVQGVAWDGANRSLVYLIVFALFSMVIWRPSSAGIVMAAYSIALAAVGAVVIVDAAGSTEAVLSFIGGRFAEPAGYPNGVAALFVGGFWPALFLASRRETPWPARGVLLAVAGLLLQLALLPQSRGALIVFPLALLVYLAVMPNRLRSLLFLALVAAATALTAGPILDVFDVISAEGDAQAALASARDAMAVAFGVLAVVGTAIAFADRSLEVPGHVARPVNAIAAGLAAAAAIAGVVLALSATGNPVDWADDRWQDFKSGYEETGFEGSRFSGDLGSNRYDFWRVGVDDQLAEAPLIGTGSDSFAVTYLQDRESEEEPLYPHSLPIRVLGGTGIIGFALLAGFAIAAIVAATRSRIGTDSRFGRGVAGAAIAAAAYFAIHASGDWLWTFTAITAPIFAWLAMAGSLAPAPDRRTPPAARSRSIAALAGAAVAAMAVVLAAASLLLPWIAFRDIDAAAAGWGADPEAAFERLDRARGLNFLSARADLVEGAIALEQGDEQRARAAFQQVLEREPESWYARLQLGVQDAAQGDREAGLVQLERAASLNPADPLVASALAAVRRNRPLEPQQVQQDLLDRACAVVGRTEETRYCE